MAELYQRERMRLSARRYAWIDSLFALPEAVLYANLVDYFDRTAVTQKPTYDVLWAAAGTPHSVFPTSYDELVRLTTGEPADVGAS